MLLKVEDEIKAESVDEKSETVVKVWQEALKSKEELPVEDKAIQSEDNQGKEGFGPEARAGDVDKGCAQVKPDCAPQVKPRQGKVISCKVTTGAKVKCPVNKTVASKLRSKKEKTQESVVHHLKKTGSLQQLKKGAVKCEVEGCLMMFSPYTQRKKEDHMRKEHGQSKLICQMCEASYFSRDGLNRHIKTVHKGENDSTKCELGDKRENDNATSTVGNVGDISPIIVKVKEPEVEVLDMEIF